MNSFCTTPMNKLTSSHLVLNKPENIRMNLAEQFSEGGSPTISTNENNNSINKPLQFIMREDSGESSPKFVLDQS